VHRHLGRCNLSGTSEGRGVLPDSVDLEESKRARKRVSNYCWKEQKLYFKGLLVPKPEERISLVSQMHEDLGHFGEQTTLAEIR